MVWATAEYNHDSTLPDCMDAKVCYQDCWCYHMPSSCGEIVAVG